jgi:hypothetical protein
MSEDTSVVETPSTPARIAGGTISAARMTPEQRTQRAKTASQARWSAARATHEGTIVMGVVQVACAVLENKTRVLSQHHFVTAMGRTGNPKSLRNKEIDSNFQTPVFLAAENLKPFISQDLLVSSTPIVYITLEGKRAYGYEATLLPKVCRVYTAARRAGVLLRHQLHIAEACELILEATSDVGIIALVDERSGYQDVRDREALQAILDKFLRREHAAWAGVFPREFYRGMFRLRGWEWKGMNPFKSPGCIAAYTRDLVYARLAPGVLRELEVRNPIRPNGGRKVRHHQFLSEKIGHPELEKHLAIIVAFMQAANSWDDLIRMVDRAVPRFGHPDQLLLPFEAYA